MNLHYSDGSCYNHFGQLKPCYSRSVIKKTFLNRKLRSPRSQCCTHRRIPFSVKGLELCMQFVKAIATKHRIAGQILMKHTMVRNSAHAKVCLEAHPFISRPQGDEHRHLYEWMECLVQHRTSSFAGLLECSRQPISDPILVSGLSFVEKMTGHTQYSMRHA